MSDDAERRLAELLRRSPSAPTELTQVQRNLVIAESRRIWFRNQAAQRRWWWTTLIAATFVAGMIGWLLRSTNEPTAPAQSANPVAIRDRDDAMDGAKRLDDLKDQRSRASEQLEEKMEKSKGKQESLVRPVATAPPGKPAAAPTVPTVAKAAPEPTVLAMRDQQRAKKDAVGRASNLSPPAEQTVTLPLAPPAVVAAAPTGARRIEADKTTDVLQKPASAQPHADRALADAADAEAGPAERAALNGAVADRSSAASADITSAADSQPVITIPANATNRPRLLAAAAIVHAVQHQAYTAKDRPIALRVAMDLIAGNTDPSADQLRRQITALLP